MLKRYEDSINNLLETVVHEGIANVSKGCLALWYGQERYTASIRNDLRARYSDMSSYIPWIKDQSLVFAEVNNTIILIRDNIILKGE
jgi:hypothetical protein